MFIKLIIQYIFINFNLNFRFDDLAMAESTEVGENVCVLCDKDIAQDSKCDIVYLGGKECIGVNQASVERGSQVKTKKGQPVHKECRKRWVNPKYIKQNQHEGPTYSSTIQCQLRSQTKSFEFQSDCIFCGECRGTACFNSPVLDENDDEQ